MWDNYTFNILPKIQQKKCARPDGNNNSKSILERIKINYKKKKKGKKQFQMKKKRVGQVGIALA